MHFVCGAERLKHGVQEPVVDVVLTDESHHSGIKAKYLGVYRPVGMHGGAFHYENESGSHLYSQREEWIVNRTFAPTEFIADMYIKVPQPRRGRGDTEELPPVVGLVGRKEWMCGRSTFEVPTTPGSEFTTHHITVELEERVADEAERAADLEAPSPAPAPARAPIWSSEI